MSNKVLAKCLLTFPDENDMIDFCNGIIDEPCDVKIYYKGKFYIVDKASDPRYFEISEEREKEKKVIA